MATNLGGVPLGSIVLGAGAGSDVINRTVTSTITFTQTISKSIEAIQQTITFAQNISFVRTFNRSVTSTLTLTHLALSPDYLEVDSVLTFSQDIQEEHSKPRTVEQNIGLTQDVDSNYVGARLVVQGINWSHIRGYNADYVREVSQNLALTQTILGVRTKRVDNTLTFTQDVDFEKLKHVQHHLELGSAIQTVVNYTRSINTQYIPFQVITKTTKFNRTIAQTLNFTQNIVQARVKGVSQTITLTQVVDGYAARGVYNTIAYAQSITYNHTNVRAINQTLNLEQNIELVRSRSASVHHGFGMNSIVHKSNVITKTVTDTLNFTQEIKREVFRRTVAQTYTPTQTVSYTPVYPRSVNNTLSLSQTIGLSKVMVQSVQSNLVFLPFRSVYVGMGDVQYYNVENIQYSLIRAYQTVKPHCVLQVPNAAITLPSPNWGDTENYGGVFTIRRSMNGIPYTHVRTLSLRKLKLPWTVAKRKAWELREFLIQNNAKLMTLTTWKGDKWFVNLMTNPFELAVRGRYDAEHEKVDVELEFEGLKVM